MSTSAVLRQDDRMCCRYYSTTDGKRLSELIKPRLHNFGVCHHSQPKAVYISQVSELGTVYDRRIEGYSDLLHAHNISSWMVPVSRMPVLI